MKKSSKRDGISLVALIVTIIVLIILTAAVIVTFMEGGIIEKAKEAVFKSDIRTYQEILAVKNAENMINLATGNGEDTPLNATELEDIQEMIPEFKEEYDGLIVISNGEIVLGTESKEPYSGWLADLGIGVAPLPENAIANKVEVGDYVAYTPGEEERSYELLGTDSGYFTPEDSYEGSDPSYYPNSLLDQTIERKHDINWRVLKIDGNKVTLISETPIDDIGFGGNLAYLNGPQQLDNIYSSLYSKTGVGTARNIDVEDVNEIMGVVIGEDVKSVYQDGDGTETEVDVGTKLGEVYDAYGWLDMTSFCNVEDLEYDNTFGYYYGDYEISYYTYNGSTYEEGKETEYDLLFNGEYWLASQTAYLMLCGDSPFYMRKIKGDVISAEYFWNTCNTWRSLSLPGRPIVELNANVEISESNTGDGTSAASAWQLK
ncbi:MAG: hypothetical protein E7311_02090 [Clostridiales bacterium]|nr:hypothetical protein [Clostridiales bacterium]